ncbi:MAG: DUF3108 domain-containing protein [Pseudomonadota bacterium]
MGITLFVIGFHFLILISFWNVDLPKRRFVDTLTLGPVMHVTLTESMHPSEPVIPTPPVLKRIENGNTIATEAVARPVEWRRVTPLDAHHRSFADSPSTQGVESAANALQASNTAKSQNFEEPLSDVVRIPNSVKLKYDVVGISSGNKYKASSELDWRHNGESYEASIRTQNAVSGVQTLSSTGRVSAEGLVPQRFLDTFTKQSILFEPEKGKIAISSKFFDTAWQKGAQDQISSLLQIGSILAAEPQKWRQGATMSIYKADAAGLTSLLLVVEAEESLVLPLGQLQTLKVANHAMSDSWPKFEYWYASSMGYVPVRMRVTQQNGDVIEQTLSEASNR